MLELIQLQERYNEEFKKSARQPSTEQSRLDKEAMDESMKICTSVIQKYNQEFEGKIPLETREKVSRLGTEQNFSNAMLKRRARIAPDDDQELGGDSPEQEEKRPQIKVRTTSHKSPPKPTIERDLDPKTTQPLQESSHEGSLDQKIQATQESQTELTAENMKKRLQTQKPTSPTQKPPSGVVQSRVQFFEQKTSHTGRSIVPKGRGGGRGVS